GGFVEVNNVARNVFNLQTTIVGEAYVKEPGVLQVEFPGHIPAEYHILDTDYENYSAVYNCFETANDTHLEYGWLLSRTQHLDQTYVDLALDVFASNGIDITLFEPTYQGDDCPYL
ncbi:hypothetical protein Pmani_040049, partial [Petrolisthes manimaculis]